MHCIVLIAIVLGFCLVLATNGPDITTSQLEYEGNRPICTSYSSLCGLDYRFAARDDLAVQLRDSANEICLCPENETCAITYDWYNMTNSFLQRIFTGANHQLLVKISYCQLPEKPKRPCGFDQPVMVSRGPGMLKFDIIGDVSCRCNRPLVPKSGWTEKGDVYLEYGCGQPKCAKRNMTVCSELTLSGETLNSHYFCRCRWNEICNGTVPVTDGQSVQHTCHLNTESVK